MDINPKIKISFCGDCNTGKTYLISNINENNTTYINQPTIGVDFNMLSEMVKGIRDIDDMLGSHQRILCEEESDSRQFKRRKLILNRGRA